MSSRRVRSRPARQWCRRCGRAHDVGEEQVEGARIDIGDRFGSAVDRGHMITRAGQQPTIISTLRAKGLPACAEAFKGRVTPKRVGV